MPFPLPADGHGSRPGRGLEAEPDVDPHAIDMQPVPLLDSGLVPLADDEDSDDDLRMDDVPIDTADDDETPSAT